MLEQPKKKKSTQVSGSGRRFINSWLIVGVYLLVLAGLILLQGLLDHFKILPYALSFIPFLIAHIVVIILLAVVEFRIWSPSLPQEARDHGDPAQAKVLEINWTGWHRRLWNHPQQREYRMRVEVTREDAPPYEATMIEYLGKSHSLTVGSTLAVKVHPQRPAIVVLAAEE
ncbi:MAG: hypothetical protein U0528_11065 [Anaerolineae bacterium]